MKHYLWQLRPYFRQVAGELVIGSLCGILMNTLVVLPAVMLGRAIDTTLAFEKGQAAFPQADRVIVLENGRIPEMGTPDTLIQQGGRFVTLLEIEASGWDWHPSLAEPPFSGFLK